MWKGGAPLGLLQDGAALPVAGLGKQEACLWVVQPLQMAREVDATRRAGGREGCRSGGKASVLCPVSLAEFLLYRGKADLTVLDENKNTALHLACSKVRPGSVVARAASGAGLDEGAGRRG